MDFEVHIHKFSDEYILKISSDIPVVHVHLYQNAELPDEYKNYWESFAKDLTHTSKKEKVLIHQRYRRFPFYRQPWLEFMDTFLYYFIN